MIPHHTGRRRGEHGWTHRSLKPATLKSDLVRGAALKRIFVIFFDNLHWFRGGFPSLLGFVFVV